MDFKGESMGRYLRRPGQVVLIPDYSWRNREHRARVSIVEDMWDSVEEWQADALSSAVGLERRDYGRVVWRGEEPEMERPSHLAKSVLSLAGEAVVALVKLTWGRWRNNGE